MDTKERNEKIRAAKAEGVTYAAIAKEHHISTARAWHIVNDKSVAGAQSVDSSPISSPSIPQAPTQEVSQDQTLTVTEGPTVPEAPELMKAGVISGEPLPMETSLGAAFTPRPEKQPMDLSDFATTFGGVMGAVLAKRGYSQLTSEELSNISMKARAASEFGPVVSPRMKALAELGIAYIAPVVKRVVTEHPIKPIKAEKKIETSTSEKPEAMSTEVAQSLQVVKPNKPYENMTMEEKIEYANKKRTKLMQEGVA